MTEQEKRDRIEELEQLLQLQQISQEQYDSDMAELQSHKSEQTYSPSIPEQVMLPPLTDQSMPPLPAPLPPPLPSQDISPSMSEQAAPPPAPDMDMPSVYETVDSSNDNERFYEALDLYNKGRFDEAAPLLDTLAYEGFTDAFVFLGSCEEYREQYAKAVNAYRKAADMDNAYAQTRLGFLYYTGKGVGQDHAKAVEWFYKAAEKDNVEAQCLLGMCYIGGTGVKADLVKAAEWYGKAATQGDARAQDALGVMYYNGQGLPQDYSRAVEWFRKSAEQGHPAAQYNLAGCYHYGGGVDQDYAKAIEWYRKSAAQNNEQAQQALALLEKEAAYFAEAEKGGAESQCSLAGMYHSGDGLPQDHVKALQWYLKAAEQGHTKAMAIAGFMYLNGQGTLKNTVRGMGWYIKAAKCGDGMAQNFVGYAYFNGETVPKDYKKAAAWFRKAAHNGVMEAQYSLGCMYHGGMGLRIDYAESLKWFKKAAAQGNQQAQEWIETLKNPAIEYGFWSYTKQIVFAIVCGIILGLLSGWLLKGISYVGPYMGVIGTALGVIIGFTGCAPKKDAPAYVKYKINKVFNRVALIIIVVLLTGPLFFGGYKIVFSQIGVFLSPSLSSSAVSPSEAISDELIAQLTDRNGNVISNGISVNVLTENGSGRIYRVAYTDNWTVISLSRTNGSSNAIALDDPEGQNAFYVEDIETGNRFPLRAIRHFVDSASGAGADLIFDAIKTNQFNMIEGEDKSDSAWHFYNITVPR